MSACQFSRPREKNSFPNAQTWVIFYTEEFYWNSIEEIQIGFISDKTIRHYTCGLLQLLGETPLGKITASLFAHDGTITNEGFFFVFGENGAIVARERRSYFFVFRLYKQSSSDNRVAIQMEHAATFSSPWLNIRACPHLH